MTDLPLFPLSTVLFPGGCLELRIFERRYLDLVRDCSRDGSGFGVCLILDGAKPASRRVPAAVGTLARITDFYTLPDGLLGISAQGGERFEVAATRVRDNGLVHADVRFWADEPELAVPPEYALLATILERLLEQIGGDLRHGRTRALRRRELGRFPPRRPAAAAVAGKAASAADDRPAAAPGAIGALSAALPARLSAFH